MASQFASTAPLPQGFSVYQPQLGAQLQFFPALGTQELDDMMNAYIPGSASLQEKRATISLDFLEHIQLTGQTFKFYHVHYSPNPAAPVAASPVGSVAASSFSNASPVNSTWGWSQASASPSTPSHSSTTKSRKSSRASSSASRYATADLSHLPGMKIMTKDGLDVTNTASRGSKTKEQRDHAHMMRIMKACDSCRRKKIRCDPSHKTQSALQTQPQAASRRAKKAHKAAAAEATALLEPVATGAIGGRDENSGIATSPLGLDPTFTFAGLDSVESTDSTYEAWENFIQYPPLDMEENYDFFFDPKGYLSPQTPASLSASPHKPPTPSSSQQELLAVSGLVEREATSSESSSPQLLFPQDTHHGSVHGSTDSNPFSPSYSFSEDSRMVSISSTRPLSPSQPSASRSEMVVYNFDIHGRTLADEWSSPSAPASPVEASLGADADTSLPRPHDPDHGPTESREQDSQAGIRENTPTDWLCGVSIAHAPARSVLVTMTPGSDGMGMIATSTLPPRLPDASGSGSVSIAILGSGIQDESQSNGQSPAERGRLRSELPVDYTSQLPPGQGVFQTETTSNGTPAPSPMATTANNSVGHSAGSVESPARVRAEHFTNAHMNPEVSPGELPVSSGTAYSPMRGATLSNVLLPCSAAPAAADDGDDTAVVATRASSAALAQPDRSAAEILDSLRSLSGQKLGREADAYRPPMAPLVGEGRIQPTSLLLPQAITPRKESMRATDEAVRLGGLVGSNQWVGSQILAQATAAILVAATVRAMLASVTGSPFVFTFASLILAAGDAFPRLWISQGDAAPCLEATPSTASSSPSDLSISKRSIYRREGHSNLVGKAEPSALGRETSRLSSRFSSLFHRSTASSFVAPLMG